MRLGGLLLAIALVTTSCGSQPSPSPDGKKSSQSSGSTGSELPGGTAGKGVLADHDFLDDQGRVRFAESAPEAEVQSALCSYLFGEPDEVARTAELEGTASLNEDSGYRSAGGNGTGFQCGYDVSGKTVLAMILWTKDSSGGDDGGATHVVTKKVGDGLFAYSAYLPGYDGPSMSKATAARWLSEGGARVQPAP